MAGLADILDLPKEVTKSAFVVRLAEAVHHPDVLLDTYAITPDILAALDRGLGLVTNAITEKRNDAAFIHGSFGSGKSHFMAVLSLLCGNDPRPWSEPKLHELLAKHEWVKHKRLLRLHLNLIDAPSIGDKLFSSYLAHMHKAHADAPLAPLFADGGLFANAASLRQKLGDDGFFAELNSGSKVDARWGKKAQETWNGARFDEARASADPRVRASLFSALVKTHFPAFAQQASAYLPFEQGLAALTHHASSLGYDGIVFFLDELVLWLASKASNPEVLNGEIGKLAKLVEGQAVEQAIPIVTFAARQRDIGEMVGEQYAGQDAKTVRDHLKFWEGRFNTISLPDKDLPAIIEKRVVHPKDAAAKQTLDAAFDSMRKSLGQTAWGVLLGELADEQGFRRIYPFSPALVEALVALSHFLQRERTALKILVEMLVGQMKDFEVGKVVPVGDLYDALAEGEEPMDGEMRVRFAGAKRLYESELLPLIRQQNETNSPPRCQRLRAENLSIGCANCAETKCRNDNRIAKTLLLAALAPNTSVFRALKVGRLVQLNHGTLKAPFPGAEVGVAAQKIRGWAREIDKVRIAGDEDPSVSVVLEGVDLRPILEAAGHYDTPGARRTKLRELLFSALDVETESNTVPGHKFVWRNTDRLGTVQFGNVRELDDSALRVADGEEWKLVIDYPFDDPGHTPQEDEQRLQRYSESGSDTSTVVWLPSFLAESVQRDLGDLVVLDRILEGDNWKSHLGNLRLDDQTRAREGLFSRASQKRERLRRALDAAYGVTKAETGVLDPTRMVNESFCVLRAGAKIRSIAAADLARGMGAAIEQLLDHVYPRHPRFSDKLTRGKLEKELDLLTRLSEADGQRLPLAKNEQNALRFSDELNLVQLRDGQATLLAQTYEEIDRTLRSENIETPDVATLARLLDPDRLRGLNREVADFVVVAYATVRGREIVRNGQPLRPLVLGKLDGTAELLQPRLPEDTDWLKALDRAGKLFGVATGKARTARNLRALQEQTSAKVEEAVRARAGEISHLLAQRAEYFTGDPPRLKTALAVENLLGQLRGADALAMTAALAAFVPETSERAMERHTRSARAVADVLGNDVHFASFPALQQSDRGEAQSILSRLRAALEADELQTELAPTLNQLSIEAQRLGVVHVHVARPTATPAAAGSAGGELQRTVTTVKELDALVEQLRGALAGGPVEIRWRPKP